MDKKILFFDSGVGGLTVLAEAMRLMPNEKFVYFADDAFAPFGNLSRDKLIERIFFVLDKFINDSNVFVLACNTATGVAIDLIRQRYRIPVIGTEPAVLPAFRTANDLPVVVLVTPLESKQEKFKKLIFEFSPYVLAIPELAPSIESFVLGQTNQKVVEEIIQKIKSFAKLVNSKHIVLGCTHYVFLKQFSELWEDFVLFDGNEGVVKRLNFFLKDKMQSTLQVQKCFVNVYDSVEIVLSSKNEEKKKKYFDILKKLLILN